jgi:AP-2 complex subunit sigma-1
LVKFTNHQMTVHFILLQNRAGKTRLAKWYSTYNDEDKERHKVEVHRIVTSRDSKFTNFIEVIIFLRLTTF